MADVCTRVGVSVFAEGCRRMSACSISAISSVIVHSATIAADRNAVPVITLVGSHLIKLL